MRQIAILLPIRTVIGSILALDALVLSGTAVAGEELLWTIELSGFFDKGPLSVVAREGRGRWLAAVGSGKRLFNGSSHDVDLGACPLIDGRMVMP